MMDMRYPSFMPNWLTVSAVQFIPKSSEIDQEKIVKSAHLLLDSGSDLEMIRNLLVLREDLHDRVVVLEVQEQEVLHELVEELVELLLQLVLLLQVLDSTAD